MVTYSQYTVLTSVPLSTQTLDWAVQWLEWSMIQGQGQSHAQVSCMPPGCWDEDSITGSSQRCIMNHCNCSIEKWFSQTNEHFTIKHQKSYLIINSITKTKKTKHEEIWLFLLNVSTISPHLTTRFCSSDQIVKWTGHYTRSSHRTLEYSLTIVSKLRVKMLWHGQLYWHLITNIDFLIPELVARCCYTWDTNNCHLATNTGK